jgi:hypothetical protein
VVVVVGKTEATQPNGYLLVRFVCQANLHIIIDVESTETGYPGGRGCVACKGSWVVVVVGKTEAPQPNRYIYLFGLWAK